MSEHHGPDRPDPAAVPDGMDASDLPSLPLAPRRRRPPVDGEVQVFAVDEQTDHPVDLTRWATLARQALAAEGVRGDAELSLLFVAEAVMAELNQGHMGGTGPTDVLAFPIDDPIGPGRWPDGGTTGPEREPPELAEAPVLLGDVVICPAMAARQAPEHAGTFDDEVALLVVHGVLHVLGHDHADETESAVMRARERALLDQFHHRS